MMSDYDNSPHADNIQWLLDNGIASGFPDGTYRPSEPVTRGQMATFLRNYDDYRHGIVEPPVEPPIEPPPSGDNYIPVPGFPDNMTPRTAAAVEKLVALGVPVGPMFMHDGTPRLVNGFTHNDGSTLILENVLIVGRIYVTNGLVILRDFEIDGNHGPFCLSASGAGRIRAERGWVYGAEDGFKNQVDFHQVVIDNLSPDYRANPHADCVQLETSGASARGTWSWLDAYFHDGRRGNSAVIVKNDLHFGDPAVVPRQSFILEDSYINGGNYTVFLRDGSSGGAPDPSEFRRVYWGGDAQFGKVSADVPAPTHWDVTSLA